MSEIKGIPTKRSTCVKIQKQTKNNNQGKGVDAGNAAKIGSTLCPLMSVDPSFFHNEVLSLGEFMDLFVQPKSFDLAKSCARHWRYGGK